MSSNKDVQDAIDVMKENQTFVRFEVTTISDTITQLSNLGKSETIIHTPPRNRNIKVEIQIKISNSPSNEKMKQLLHGSKMIIPKQMKIENSPIYILLDDEDTFNNPKPFTYNPHDFVNKEKQFR